MSDRNQYDHDELLLDHEYDGIREYDNPMPRWWKNLFWATIVFSILYVINIGPMGSGRGRIAQYEEEMAAARARQPAAAQVLDDARLAAMAKDPQVLALGRQTFAQSCAACHRADGGGLIGPNLTDGSWLHGGRPTEVLHVVQSGVLAKGMPAWEKVLKPDQVAAVSAYVATLRDAPAKDGKQPEGTPAASAAVAPAASPAPASTGS
jgi:cytochrome c oxidase cbb3-type subunit 3